MTLDPQELAHNKFVLNLPKAFDFSVHDAFRDAFKQLMTKNPTQVELDFAEVQVLDSAGLGMLMFAKHEAESQSCPLVLTNVPDGQPRQVLELVRFDRLFTIRFAEPTAATTE